MRRGSCLSPAGPPPDKTLDRAGRRAGFRGSAACVVTVLRHPEAGLPGLRTRAQNDEASCACMAPQRPLGHPRSRERAQVRLPRAGGCRCPISLGAGWPAPHRVRAVPNAALVAETLECLDLRPPAPARSTLTGIAQPPGPRLGTAAAEISERDRYCVPYEPGHGPPCQWLRHLPDLPLELGQVRHVQRGPGGRRAHRSLLVTKSECERAVADWNQAMDDNYVDDATWFTCD